MSALAENLKTVRKDNKLSQAAFAKALGITGRSVQNYEAGKRVPSEELLAQVAKLYNVSTAWLKGEEEAPAVCEPAEAAPEVKEETSPKPVQTAQETTSPAIILQSLMGGEVSLDDILARVAEAADNVEEIYIKTEENRAYWVSKESSGAVLLWD